MSYIANTLLSTRLLKVKRLLIERKRELTNQPHLVTVYLAIDDPYSYLLLQVLEDFQRRFSIQYDFRTVLNKQPEMYPAPELWQKNAMKDGCYLASLYSLDFPDVSPTYTSQLKEKITAQLLHWELQSSYLQNSLLLFKAYWHDDVEVVEQLVSSSITNHVECYQQHLNANERLLKDNGHYLSAMLSYGSEWYWGLDRLQYLERRFNELNIQTSDESSILYDATHRSLFSGFNGESEVIDRKKMLTPIEMYWSIRSPYSYIAICRARELAKKYSVPLIIKPVLPMVMRRMQVPKNKSHYIVRDASREAHQLNIPFGRIADPLGKGVIHCYALYDMAISYGKANEFLESCARGVWSEGIRSDTLSGLKILVERVGLPWGEAKTLINNDNWRLWAQSNLAELYSNDLWGVPSFKYAQVKVFGQDRIACLEQEIVKSLNLKRLSIAPG